MDDNEVITVTVEPMQSVLVAVMATPASIPAELIPVLSLPGGEGSTYTWNQVQALATWTVPHNLGRFPSVTAVDTTGGVVIPDLRYIDKNVVQITHGAALAGKAYLN